MVQQITRRMGEFESKDIYKLETRAPGTYFVDTLIEGNSLLSTVFVSTIDPGASVTVKYVDYTMGEEEGEIFPLDEHVPITTAMTVNRITITRIHNKPRIFVEVVGGNARFSVYITVVSSFASDLDSALVYENDLVNFARNKGIPIGVIDDATDTWKLLRSFNGALNVNVNTPILLKSINKRMYNITTNAVPTTINNHINYIVPINKQFTFLTGFGSANSWTKWKMRINNLPCLTVRSAMDAPNVRIDLNNPFTLIAGEQLEIDAINDTFTGTNCEIETFIYGIEETI
jgi:hypothetical protein